MAARKSPYRKKGNRNKRNILPAALASGAAGTALMTSAIPGYYRDAKGVLRDAKSQAGKFVSRFRNPDDIEFLNDMAPLTSIGHVGFTQDGLEEFVRDGYIYHAFSNTPVFDDGYRMGTPVESLELTQQENPAKFDRCVRAVQARGGASNAYAVCTAAGTKNPMVLMETERPTDAHEYAKSARKVYRGVKVERVGHSWRVVADQMWKGIKKSFDRRNPQSESDALYETFHGAPPSETLEIIETEHIHSHLAGLGELVSLVVKLEAGKFKGEKFDMKAPDPESSAPEQIIHLSANEAATQLYLVGGDQSIDLDAMGFRDSFTVTHEGEKFDVTDIRDLMVIGKIMRLMYRTQKAFDKFEVVDYFHKAGEDTKERPLLLYDVPNQRLKIAGGEYGIDARGVIN